MQSLEIKTLVDITQTGQTKFKSQDRLLINQQANWNTFLQVLSMRINPIFDGSPVKVTRALEPEEFGSDYKEKEYNVWEFKFQSERDEALTPEMLREDFDLIPVIKGLEESIINNNDAFRTTGMAQNIVFMYADNKESLET
tara:strand:+ start:2758 stop:3180 length:423 start_codon:yes stop_codon:yes gene_type:complete